MKQLIFAMGLMALLSCKDNKFQETDAVLETEVETIETTKEIHHDDSSSILDNSWVKEIKLDNGSKWLANNETNEGVEKMLHHIKTEATQTLDDYHNLAALLNADKNYVVKNCSMKGASHDNLHVWLLPLMAKIDALAETQSLEDAAQIKKAIEENLQAYSDYFQ